MGLSTEHYGVNMASDQPMLKHRAVHCTAMVTVFDVAPPMPKAITTGTAAPLDEPAGTSASTYLVLAYQPWGKPGK